MNGTERMSDKGLSVVDDEEFYQEQYHKLQVFQTGAKNTHNKTRVISYVQANNTPRGPTSDISRNVSDLVILDDFDEEGNLRSKGTVIIRGARKELQTLDATTNPMDKRKANRVQMQFQIVEKKERLRTKPTRPLPQSKDEVPASAQLEKPLQINSPSTRTRNEANTWIEVHKKDAELTWWKSPRPAPAPAKRGSNPKMAIKAFESFVGNESFAERDGMPMSARRGLVDQAPDSARVRKDPRAESEDPVKPRPSNRSSVKAMYEPFPSRRIRNTSSVLRRSSVPAAGRAPHPPPPTARRLDFQERTERLLSGPGLSDEDAAALHKNFERIGSMFKHVQAAKESGRISEQQYYSAVSELEHRSKKNAEVVFAEDVLPFDRHTEVSSTKMTERRSSLADYSIGLHFDDAPMTPKTPRRPHSARARGSNDVMTSPARNHRILKGQSHAPAIPQTPRQKAKAFGDVLYPYKNATPRAVGTVSIPCVLACINVSFMLCEHLTRHQNSSISAHNPSNEPVTGSNHTGSS